MRICRIIHRKTSLERKAWQAGHCSFGGSVSGFGASCRSIMAAVTIYPSMTSGPDTPKAVLDVGLLVVLSHKSKNLEGEGPPSQRL